MKKKYKIKDKVFVKKVGSYKIIKDIEVFGDLILYYMDDMTAYPQDELFINERHLLCKNLLSNPLSDEEQQNILDLI